jgi:hypothetical protein
MHTETTSNIIFAAMTIVVFVGTAVVSLQTLPACGLFY